MLLILTPINLYFFHLKKKKKKKGFLVCLTFYESRGKKVENELTKYVNKHSSQDRDE